MERQHGAALIVDDHELFRAGFSSMLRRECQFEDIIEAKTFDEALQILGERSDVTFASFDLAMPGVGSALSLQSVREVFPAVCVCVVTGSKRREDILLSLTAGVHGYVLKTWSTAEIADAVRKVLNGTIFVPSNLADIPANDGVSAAPLALDKLKDYGVRLTPRQQDVLRLIRSGKSNKEIARLLNLTESTIKVHTNGLYKALGVHNRSSAAARRAD